MPAIVVVGAQWGDEGKGKVVDILTEFANVVVRFQGGDNAGHTVIVGDEKIILHLIPSGVLRRDTRCVLAHGMVIRPEKLVAEIDALAQRGEGAVLGEHHLALQALVHVLGGSPVHVAVGGAVERLTLALRESRDRRGLSLRPYQTGNTDEGEDQHQHHEKSSNSMNFHCSPPHSSITTEA